MLMLILYAFMAIKKLTVKIVVIYNDFECIQYSFDKLYFSYKWIRLNCCSILYCKVRIKVQSFVLSFSETIKLQCLGMYSLGTEKRMLYISIYQQMNTKICIKVRCYVLFKIICFLQGFSPVVQNEFPREISYAFHRILHRNFF